MVDTFKAQILSHYIESKQGQFPIPLIFNFSKNKIHFPSELKEKISRLDFDPFDGSTLTDKTNYTLERVYHVDTDKPVYEISFGQDTKRYIKVEWDERLKLMWIHKRYWVHKEPLGIAALIISIIALFK